MQTLDDIRNRLRAANREEFAVLEHALIADTRKGVQQALEQARRRLDAEDAERERLESLYRFQAELAEGGLVLGLDEVGRGPVAGPLSVAGVVLPDELRLEGLNDSKQLSPAKREALAQEIKQHAKAWTVQHLSPQDIDAQGMTASLRRAFLAAIQAIEAQGFHPDVILLDGNPLHLDPRERNVVRGDAKCASIAAASIIAKVERDALMCDLGKRYPEYDFASNKGYASAEHIEAIRLYGLSPVHRASFCSSFFQESLF